MPSVSRDVVDETWEELSSRSQEERAALTDEMREEQATLRAYLLGIRDSFTPEEQAHLFFLSAALWKMMSGGDRLLGKVSKGRLEKAGTRNAQWLQTLSKDSDADFYQAILSLMETYPEPEPLRFIAERLASDAAFREESFAQAFYYLKTVLDALVYSLWK